MSCMILKVRSVEIMGGVIAVTSPSFLSEYSYCTRTWTDIG